ARFEKWNGRALTAALATELANQIGMQDSVLARQQKSGDANRSLHKAYHIWLSTRDMARVGLLMLREGRWTEGQQVVSREWARRITGLVTPLNEMNPPELRSLGTGGRWGYGYMWWGWEAPD